MAVKKHLGSVRKEYTKSALSEEEINKNPFLQFDKWFNQVIKLQIDEPNAMTLATSDKNGIPSARIVLLKSYDDRGFSFCTNYKSRKGKDLQQNPKAALLFYWKELERQVRIDGLVEKLPTEESENYFNERPFESRIAALASLQSQILPDRKSLEEKFKALKNEYEGKYVPLPLDWGCYLVIPYRFEFWQGRENRLHDRICFEKSGNDWKIFRLSP